MKTKLAFLSLTLLILGLFNSCKDDETEEPQPSPKEILTDGFWDYYKVEIYDSSGNLTNTYNLNYQVEFTNAGNYYFYDDTGSLDDYGTYTLQEDTEPVKIILYPEIGGEYEFSVIKLEESEMEWKFEDSSGMYFLYYLSR